MTPRVYASPQAFRQGLDEHLRTAAGGGADLQRRRQLLVFDRFLARVAAVFGDAATLKGHAYTLPRLRPNSRVKDLPDIALLATVQALDAARLRAAFKTTFDFRRSHDVPGSLPLPPATWATPYAAMARDDGLAWATLDDVAAAAAAFLDPVLAGAATGAWDPERWGWLPPTSH